MWGQVLIILKNNVASGIIPMRVGTRGFVYGSDGQAEDHPHACGDKSSTLTSSPVRAGSSPCVWGQVLYVFHASKSPWIIPMRVGTSTIWSDTNDKTRDHPHACGDKYLYRFTAYAGAGSSPCVWGQDADRLYEYDRIRIIPMRVGTSDLAGSLQGLKQDHPHACGDKDRLSHLKSNGIGSSPCVWGQVKPCRVWLT